MDPTIRICKSAFAGAAALALLSPIPADALVDERLDTFIQAWVARVSDDDAQAASKYAKLLDKDPDNRSFSDGLWQSALVAGDRKRALRAARTQELQGGASEASLLIYADAMARRDWKDARAAVAGISETSNYAFLRPLFEAWLRAEQGEAHRFPLQPKAQILRYYATGQRAYLDLALGDYDKARISAGAFADIDDEFARELRIRVAPVLAANGNVGLARKLTADLLPADILASHLQRPDPKRLRDITAADGLSALYNRLSRSLLQQEMPEQALATARAASWIAPHDHAVKMTLARILKELGHPQRGDAILAEIDVESPYFARSAVTRIQNRLRSDSPEGAVELAEKALSQRNVPELAILRGQAMEKAGRLEEAKQIFTALIDEAARQRVSPRRRAIYHLYLAMVQHKQGNWPAARKSLEKGKALNPQNPYIINYLAYSLLERREEVEVSLGMLQRAHRLAPESAAITDSLGWGYFLTGDYRNAVRYLEKAARKAGNDSTIYDHLGDAYWLAGRFVDARYAWNTAASTADDDKELAARLKAKIDGGLKPGAATE